MEGYTVYARLAIVVYVDQRDTHKSDYMKDKYNYLILIVVRKK